MALTTPSGVLTNALQQAASIPAYSPSGGGSRQAAALTPWTPIGPAPTSANNGWGATSGRVTALAYDGPHHILYAGGAAGGVWKSANNGVTWAPLTDTQPSLAIGALALDPSNPLIIYAGTGEPNFSVDSYYGDGILKSINGGATWTVLAQETFSQNWHISKIVVDPRNTQHVLVAGDLGVWLSTDGGASWQQGLGCVNVSGYCITPDVTDLVVDSTTNPSTVYAAVGYPFGGLTGTLNGIYKSVDGGAYFSTVPIGTGYPTGDSIGRIALARGNANHRLLYMTASDPLSSASLGVWSSTDAGATWTQVARARSAGGPDLFGNDTDHLEQQGWYDMFLGVDPANDASLYVGGINIFHSTDGGHTWADITHVYNASGPTVHPDQHAIVFSSAGAPSPFYVGDDGGVYSSTTAGASWNDNNGNLAITEFYGGSTTANLASSRVIWGGTQDNGTQKYTGNPIWPQEIGGDGTLTANDPTNPNIAYQEFPGLGINKTTDGGAHWVPATSGINPNGTDVAEWVAPMIMDPTNPARLLAGTNYLYETTDGATSWHAISPSLSPYAALSAIAIARGAPNTIYVGTGDGHIWATTNDGATWTERTAGTVGTLGYYVTALAVSPTNPLDVVVTFSGFDGAGNGGHVYRSTNGGASWQDVSKLLPDTPVSSVLRNPTSPTTFYLGTDTGFFFTINGGASWQRYQLGLPGAPIDQLFADGSFSTFVLATHGRGMFTLPTSALGGQGTTYYVAPAGSNSNTCLAATTPCATIGGALVKAHAGDTISIAAGTYPETLTIAKDVSLIGAGPTQTIIDASYNGTAVAIPSGKVSISGITIRDGTGSTACYSTTCAGGILNAGTLALSNSVLTNNSADYGGGIYNLGLLTASRVTFSGNSATFGGGAIDNAYNGGIFMSSSTLSGNTAGFGGAILENGALTLTGSRLTTNRATAGDGGGISIATSYNTTVSLSADVITSNTAPGGNGGGVSNAYGTLLLSGTTFASNHALLGGGIYNTGMLTLSNSTLANNSANRGGAIGNDAAGGITLSGGTLSGNTASFGGAIFSNGALTLKGSKITGNTATAGDGGGVYSSTSTGTTVTLTSALITNNSALISGSLPNATIRLPRTEAQGSGGGVENAFGTVVLSGTTILGNRANVGGGVDNGDYSGSTLQIIGSTISGNQATYGGGINNNDSLTVTGSTITTNVAGYEGGGLWFYGGTTTVLASTFSANQASQGGAIFDFGGVTTLTNSTMNGNTASEGGSIDQRGGALVLASATISGNQGDNGGGVFINASATASTKNSILAANTATASGPDCNGALSTAGYNLLGSNAGCTGLTNGVNGDQVGSAAAPRNPGLGPLLNNGGPTATMALPSTSPAVDRGNPAGCTDPQGALLTIDQRGLPRTDAVTHRCDIGAYELQKQVSGPAYPTSTVDQPTSPDGFSWYNPTGVQQAGGLIASAASNASSPVQMDILANSAFKFNIPANATITGILVQINRHASQHSAGRFITDAIVQLLKNGSPVGANKANTVAQWDNAAYHVVSYGSPTDLWGTTWTPSDINNANFGINFTAQGEDQSGSTSSADVDFIRLIVYYTT